MGARKLRLNGEGLDSRRFPADSRKRPLVSRAGDLWRGGDMEVNSIVIVSLASPKEKVWGLLLALNSAGITVRGIQLEYFDDFIRQVIDSEEASVGPTTIFYPMYRVERIAVDEPSGSIPSLAERFQKKIGLSIQEYLGTGAPRA
jgi:hypothetical protein